MTRSIEHKPVPGLRAGDWLVRLVLPLYLGGGALAKLATGDPSSLPPIVQRWLQDVPGLDPKTGFLLIVAAELVLAMVLALHRGLARPVAVLVLTLFGALLIQQWATGVATCGCFGALTMPPWAMLVIDGLLLAGVLLLPRRRLPPGAADVSLPRWGVLAGLSVAATVAVLVGGRAWVAGRWHTGPGCAALPESGMVRVDIDPREWVGQRVSDTPLACYLPAGAIASVKADVQEWVLYDHACPHCHHLFEVEHAQPRPAVEGVVVALNMNPAPIAPELDVKCPSCVRLRPDPRVRLNTPRTPVIFTVRNDVIESVRIP